MSAPPVVLTTIDVMTREELDQVVGWARGEGWGPGPGDAAAFALADREGFLAARVDGRMVAGIAALNWGPDFAYVGLFITERSWRSQGVGSSLVAAALEHVGDRLIGVDGVLEQVPYYQRLGLRTAHMHVRFASGPRWRPAAWARPTGGFTVVPGRADLVAAAVAYDAALFPGERASFMAGWLDPDSSWRCWSAALDHAGRLVGFGAVRSASAGAKIGPLQADTPEVAAALLDALATVAAGPILLDIPDVNPEAVSLVTARGMVPVFRCARMYLGPAPVLPLERSYGVCTLELG